MPSVSPRISCYRPRRPLHRKDNARDVLQRAAPRLSCLPRFYIGTERTIGRSRHQPLLAAGAGIARGGGHLNIALTMRGRRPGHSHRPVRARTFSQRYVRGTASPSSVKKHARSALEQSVSPAHPSQRTFSVVSATRHPDRTESRSCRPPVWLRSARPS
jgi:hypothetical protein